MTFLVATATTRKESLIAMATAVITKNFGRHGDQVFL